ncbi:MAG: tRNA (N(6)-L-threonylcarbamoyladenosine(37)-C(2))-methylthiotransferase MtaB [Chlamydiales bacterium]|nr:tRNA (N(6)-L-threonylcarbamoyladenosine(37)-C(2))-methylthiotransferase MtaB [Chlamydiales bacterium]
MNRKKFLISTLGCRTNQYESQAYRDQLLSLGFEESTNNHDADICIVNTCTVTESADQKSKYQIKQLHKQHPQAKIYVTGCLAERERDLLATFGGVDKVIPNLEKEKLLQIALPEEENLPEFAIKRFESHTRAFIKVQDGCNSFCSYCIIPYVRGRSRSKTIPQIIEEIKELGANGYKEIVLTGINIGDFDGGVSKGELKKRLSDIVYAVDEIEGIERIRISSIDPDEVEDDLLNALITCKKACKSMHIVLQAGSNTILKRMNRKYTIQEFYEATRKLTSAHPDFTFTTDVIVGFPGETEKDFEETMNVMKKVQFAKVHMFPFSVRPGTRAARFKEFIAPEIISQRKEEVLRLAEQIAFDLRANYVGRNMKVLLESKEDGECLFGHTDNFLPVFVKGYHLKPNDIVQVKLIENTEKGLMGCVI